MNKRILAGVLAVGMLLGLSACGQTGGTDSAAGETIRIVYPTSRTMGDKGIAEFREWFEENYPGVELEMTSSSSTTINDTVSSALEHGDGPDIFAFTEYDTFYRKGYLADITSVEALTQFRTSSVRELERENRVYGLPMGGGKLFGLCYNKTLFEQYGIPLPTSDEDMQYLLKRVYQAIVDQGLDIRPVSASMLYPLHTAVAMNSLLVDYNQTAEYLAWQQNFQNGTAAFTDPEFQDYLDLIDKVLVAEEDDNGTALPEGGKVFTAEDLTNTHEDETAHFLNGGSFMYLGDVTRCYGSLDSGSLYGAGDIYATGIPVGIEGVSYISFMDDLYLGVNSQFEEYSPAKQEIITDILNYVVNGNENIQNIFTFTGDYCSVYLEGESIKTQNDPFFTEINASINQNYVAQNVSNNTFSGIFGRCLIAWKKGALSQIVPGSGSDIEKVTEILETYRTEGTDLFEKSSEPIGTSDRTFPFSSSVMRSQETALGNQIADMARDCMGTDFALINAGGVRAAINEGDISEQTLNEVLPYGNNLVKIEVSGATLKAALTNAFDVSPADKEGKFGMISGLRVVLKTDEASHAEYQRQMDEWSAAHPDASETDRMNQMKTVVADMTEQDSKTLHLKLISVTDAEGNELEDDKIYTVATLDYLLKGKDDYTMLGILSSDSDADTSIRVFDQAGDEITGTPEEMTQQITQNCDLLVRAFAQWVKDGNTLDSDIDGRITIEDFIYYE